MRNTGIIAALLLALVSSSVLAAKVPAGAFLNTPVGGVQQLSQQVIDDPIVAARYAKHFCTSRNAVLEYFQENLKIGRLTQDLDCTVYQITGRTDVVATQRVLPKGAYVFVAANGRPFLEASSGDPLTSSLPLRAMNSDRSAAIEPTASSSASTSASLPADNVVTKVLGAPAAEVGATTAAPVAIAAAPMVDPTVELVGSMPVGAAAASTIARSGLSTAVLGVAALAGGLALAGGGGGSGASTQLANTNPVPEPASLMFLATAGLGVCLVRFRRR